MELKFVKVYVIITYNVVRSKGERKPKANYLVVICLLINCLDDRLNENDEHDAVFQGITSSSS